MIRHRCAQCGQSINRTDHFFEASDGTRCAACRAGRIRKDQAPAFAALPPLGLAALAGADRPHPRG